MCVSKTAFGRSITILLVAVSVGLFAFAAKEFVAPKAFPAKTYPAVDDHPTEKVAVAVDPYDTPEKSAIFAINYREHGFMPLNIIITNDGGSPVALAGMKVELVTRDRTKIAPADDDDIYRRITRMNRSGGQSPSGPRLPIPLPKSKDKQGIPKEAYGELESAKFKARAVEPGGTQSGFLFFDIGNLSNPLAGARLFITGVRDNNGNELMYFEVPLEKYLGYTPPVDPNAPKQ
jgi:hypothetical protein